MKKKKICQKSPEGKNVREKKKINNGDKITLKVVIT